jgi:hypothetical protein
MINHPPTDPINTLLVQLHFVSMIQRRRVLTKSFPDTTGRPYRDADLPAERGRSAYLRCG